MFKGNKFLRNVFAKMFLRFGHESAKTAKINYRKFFFLDAYRIVVEKRLFLTNKSVIYYFLIRIQVYGRERLPPPPKKKQEKIMQRVLFDLFF